VTTTLFTFAVSVGLLMLVLGILGIAVNRVLHDRPRLAVLDPTPGSSDRPQPLPDRCAHCLDAVALPHLRGGAKVCDRCAAAIDVELDASDRARPSTVDLPWRYVDPDGDELRIAVYTYEGRKVAVVEQSAAEGRSAVVHLDSHEARMGAAAAILAADRAIGDTSTEDGAA
jgi:hypothetical protein